MRAKNLSGVAALALVASSLMPVAPASADTLREAMVQAYNGNPTFRIWPRGTHRLLGVINWDYETNEEIDLPPAVVEALTPHAFDKEVWGNFRVCPREPSRNGTMRPVDLVDARVLVTRDYGASRRP